MLVSVSNANEQGIMVQTPANSGRWVYTATTAVPEGSDVRIAVEVSDRPGGTPNH